VKQYGILAHLGKIAKKILAKTEKKTFSTRVQSKSILYPKKTKKKGDKIFKYIS